jgi:hypothetical protein
MLQRVKSIFRALDAVFTALFVLAAYLQLNDPDPARWVAMYLAGAVVSALSFAGRARRDVALGVAAVAVAWAAIWLPDVLRHVPVFRDVVGDPMMFKPGVELMREFMGLVIVAGWSGGVAVRVWRKPAAG